METVRLGLDFDKLIPLTVQTFCSFQQGFTRLQILVVTDTNKIIKQFIGQFYRFLLRKNITAGVAVGREPYFFGVAYEVSLVVVQALIMLAEVAGTTPSFNLNDIRNHISHQDLERLKEKLDYVNTPDAEQLCLDMQKILSTPADYYSKVASSLRVALTELTSGSVGQIIGKADENRFIKRLEQGKGIILVVQLGSLLTKRPAYTAGKVIISMIQAFVGRVYSSGKSVTPSLVLHIDEAQSVLYHGIEDLFAKAGGAEVLIHGYCQSISQLYAEVGEDRAALAHDLGKLQSLRGYLYSLGEHPLAAGRPLAGIAGFNELPKKEEILRAVRLHHKMVQGLLGKTLKKADQYIFWTSGTGIGSRETQKSFPHNKKVKK